MKKSMILVMAAAAAAMTLVSCTKELNGNNEENNQTSGLRTLTVSFAPNTRTYLDTDGLKPLWTGDGTEKISLNGIDYTVPSAAAGKDSFTLTTTIEGDITAVYPASAWNNSAPYFNVGASQDGSFANANICVASAKAGDTELSFKNQTAIIKVNVPEGTKKLTLTSLNPIENSGQRGESGAVAIADDSATEITVSNDSGIPNPCYVSILAPASGAVLLQDLNVDVEYSENKKAQGGFSPSAITAKGETPSTYVVEANTIYTLSESSLHEYVIADGKKWATMNVGATEANPNGLYFAWGETTGHEANDAKTAFKESYSFSWANCPFATSNDPKFTKYVPSSMSDTYWSGEGPVDNKTVLDLEDDAAFWNWGGAWRIPTKGEFETFAAYNSYDSGNFEHKGVTFPTAGYGSGAKLNNAGSRGSYWSSSLCTDKPCNAYYFYFKRAEWGMNNGDRYYGYSVRPLSE